MLQIKACIFDLDGVIVNTAKYHYLAWKKLASELGFEFTEEDNEKLKGVSRMDSLDILLKVGNMNFNQEIKQQLAIKKNKWYLEYINNMNEKEILPGVIKFLKILRDKDIKIALGSVSRNAMQIINTVNLNKYFDVIVDGNKITKAKPDPEVFLKAAEELNINPYECVVFEDAAAGIQAAINANMYSIGVGSKDILNKADKVITDFENVNLDLIKF